MIKTILAAASVIILVAAGMPSSAAPSKAVASSAAAQEIPSAMNFPSSVGEVTFPHQKHTKDLAIKCVNCHHQINARPLNTPHPDYFGSSWINCRTCHDESEKVAQKAYVCSECHQARPRNIVDETLSAKVVIHKQCWNCHEVGTGKEASDGCEKCHSGKKTS
jgi:hypothetical protein